MKNFSQFLKEEIDIKGNQGIPDDFTDNADRQARKNLGVEIDSTTSERQIGPQLGSLVSQGMNIMFQGIPPQQIIPMIQGRGPVPQQLEDKYVKLEELAKRIILAEYKDILDASEKPIELDIKMLRPGKQVSSEIPEMKDVPSLPSQEEIKDPELRKAVDKKKILNVINQGEAKATKNIIKDKSIVEEGLSEIFGNNWETIYNIWLQTTDMANKLDWASPIEIKSEMMRDAQEFMAGSCQVKWEKDDEDDEDNDDENNEENSYQDEDGTIMTGDQDDYDKIIIKAVGIDFPMLIHEAVKGIWALIKSGAIKDDEELAQLIAQNTSSFEDEAQDFRYGVPMQAMFRDFINECKDSNKYSQMRLRIYGKMALDKDRGGDFTDEEFLQLTKEIFSTFDLVEEGTLEFTLNQEKFNSSTAKRKIEKIISDIITAEKEYENELSKWEMEQKFSGSEESNDDDNDFNDYLSGLGISRAKEEVNDDDDDDDDDVDTLLDKLSSAKTEEEKQEIMKKLNKLTESLSEDGKRIYDIEIQRILESTKYHNRRRK